MHMPLMTYSIPYQKRAAAVKKTEIICVHNFPMLAGLFTLGPESGDIEPVGEDSAAGIAFAVVVSAGAVDVKITLGSSGSKI